MARGSAQAGDQPDPRDAQVTRLRCPMLQVNTMMLPRLADIEKDLLLRRKLAQEEHWLGEVEGIDSTLTFLRTKQAESARLTKRPTTDLGIPRPRPEKTQ
ncbi:hypothetical protein [Streptomyces sp. NBC_00038]|uniref:hypothetical protein n=1 Tax=Streptomyces sp. NBC_00038 TaxID=2903615 RepID=UPI0022516058|nr:hypothetical protein [Streptomyces sp. NBC_00038]MCX5563072.1 hypothetical protein [Streptomyces sp. NBC_00038]